MAIASKLTFVALLVAVPAAAEPGPPLDASAPGDAELRPPGSTEPAVRPPRVVHRPRPSRLETTERWGGGVRLTGLSGIGALPGVNYGAELAGMLRRDELFAELALGHWMPEKTYIVTDHPEQVELALDVWTLRAGWASMHMPLRGWLLVEVGEVAGAREMPGVVSRMVMGETPQQRQWRAAGGGLGVAWPIADVVRLVGTLEIAIPLIHERLMLDQGAAYQPDWMSARYSIGLEVGWR